ncbi:copper resistance CopC family protein [Bradyrhizobium cenepequi]|uniref:copper resistance CopC family protein n=1 Tax=Bradyrhizobium cenepequi TaxID=2821403 RepID=UPI001CE23F2F|nr:copper resistance CopC family protein [Bradyrhizobium cenepequi]MCA6106755.1 copper resistance protein CopC [Bradyrhizobium cenepequi]
MRHRIPLPFSALILLLLSFQEATAHAIVIKSSPAADAVMPAGNVPIHLQFNSRIDHDRSKVMLVGPSGIQQRLTPAADSAADVLDAKAEGLSPGVWRLRWQVLSVDGHITRGDIPFTVR